MAKYFESLDYKTKIYLAAAPVWIIDKSKNKYKLKFLSVFSNTSHNQQHLRWKIDYQPEVVSKGVLTVRNLNKLAI